MEQQDFVGGWVLPYLPKEHREKIINLEPHLQTRICGLLATEIKRFREIMGEKCEKLIHQFSSEDDPDLSKFLTIRLFAEKYPAFPEGFFRKLVSNDPAFVAKVCRRINKNIYISVEDFWEWLNGKTVTR